MTRYYIQCIENVIGNCALWWRPDSKGYTCDLNQAGEYDEDEARRIERIRGIDKPIPVDVARGMERAHVSKEVVDRWRCENLPKPPRTCARSNPGCKAPAVYSTGKSCRATCNLCGAAVCSNPGCSKRRGAVRLCSVCIENRVRS